jgi:transposase
MPKSHPPYPREFRQRIVELSGKGVRSKNWRASLEPSAQAIRNWVKQAAVDAGERSDGLTTEEREERCDGCVARIACSAKSERS